MVLTCMSIVLGSMEISIKQLTLFAVVVMAVSAVAVTAETVDAEESTESFTYTLNNGQLFVDGYSGDNVVVNIPAQAVYNGQNYAVVGISNNAFEANTTIEEVIIPESVEIIGDGAFYGCSNLKFVTVSGDSLIGTSAFMYCSSLEFIDLKGNPTISGPTTFMGVSCTVRTSTEGILDEYSPNPSFEYVGLNEHIIRYSLVGAPDSVPSLGFDMVEVGSALNLPTEAVVEGYDIAISVDGTAIPDAYVQPDKDITVTLTYTLKQYTVTFVADGKTVQTLTLKHGETITAPVTNPTKEQDEKNTYTFAGWDGFTAGMTATQDVTFNAKFTETPRTYTVSFVSEGVPVQTQTLAYGAVITAPAEDPVKESEQGVDYRFVGWDGFTEGMTVTGDATFTAKFDSTDHVYTIQFVSDGEVVSTLQLGYGDTITAPAEDPVKESADGVDYVFAGWDGFTEDMTVTGDMTFEAVFDEVPQDDGGDSTWIYVAVVIVVVLVVLALVVLRKHL